jgi:hypothetical protein
MTLRDLAEYDVNNRLLAVPGVAAVERLGGYLRQFQIQLDPERMSARVVSLDEVMHAVEESNMNASGGIIAQGSIEWTVQALGRAHTVDDLRRAVVTTRGDVPILLGDVADGREAAAVPRGVAHRLKGEVVSARRRWPRGDAGWRVRRSHHPGIDRQPASGADRDVHNPAVDRAGGPAFETTRHWTQHDDTRGGLAIAVGLLVDAAIIMVENILHRLSGGTTAPDRRERALTAAREVARPIAFATLIVIVVFLPLFGMTGIEGRMYQPLPAAVIAAMAAALVLSVTLVSSREAPNSRRLAIVLALVVLYRRSCSYRTSSTSTICTCGRSQAASSRCLRTSHALATTITIRYCEGKRHAQGAIRDSSYDDPNRWACLVRSNHSSDVGRMTRPASVSFVAELRPLAGRASAFERAAPAPGAAHTGLPARESHQRSRRRGRAGGGHFCCIFCIMLIMFMHPFMCSFI